MNRLEDVNFDRASVVPASPFDCRLLTKLAEAGKILATLIMALEILAGNGARAAKPQKVALPNGEVLYFGKKPSSHSSLEGIEENVHNGQSAVHNALWEVLTASAKYFYHEDAVKIYNYALSPEGKSELIRAISGNNGAHQKIPDALSNVNAWATSNGFQTIPISPKN